MVKDILMNEENLNELIEKCEKFNENENHFSFGNVKEIEKVKKYENVFKAFMELVETKVFYLAVGNFINSHGKYITIEC